MGLINNSKKGFVFSFFVFFLIIVLFAFLSLSFNDDIFNTDSEFEVARTLNLNDQVVYFRDSYLHDSMRYSLYMSVKGLIDQLNTSPSLHSQLSMNHSMLNSLIYEALTNETFNSNSNSYLENISIDEMTLSFRQNFLDNNRANLSVTLDNVNLFEVNPYRVRAQLDLTYNITTLDNISNWYFQEKIFVSTSIFDLQDPKFLNHPVFNSNPIISPVERLRGSFNWSTDSFNTTLINSYQTVYFEPTYRYTLGNSFLSSLLNHSRSSYKNVIGFWSFDHDVEENQVYDTAQYNNNGNVTHQGNSILLLGFENRGPGNFLDSSYMENHISLDLIQVINSGCIRQECINLTTSDSLSGNIDGFNNSEFSISMWVNLRNNNSEIFSLDDLELSITLDNAIRVYDGSSLVNSNINVIELNRWSHVSFSYDGENSSVFLNGRVILRTDELNFNSIISSPTLTVGSFDFEGLVDEVSVYLTSLDTSLNSFLLQQRRAHPIDYRDSLFDTAIFFNGRDNRLNISDFDFSQLDSQFTFEIWFNLFDNQSEYSLLDSEDITLKFNESSVCSNKLFVNVSGTVLCIENNLDLHERWNYLALTYNGSDLSSYINGNLTNSTSLASLSFSSDPDLILGGNQNIFFNGLIDEFKVYNESLEPNIISMHYYNYQGLSKGCCNYFSLVNHNQMLSDPATYSNNISSSIEGFTDYYVNGRDWDVTLYSIDNFTSTDSSQVYYNLLADFCTLAVYNIFSWGNATVLIDSSDPSSVSCTDLIRDGFY